MVELNASQSIVTPYKKKVHTSLGADNLTVDVIIML